jgi:hypothetical protein
MLYVSMRATQRRQNSWGREGEEALTQQAMLLWLRPGEEHWPAAGLAHKV